MRTIPPELRHHAAWLETPLPPVELSIEVFPPKTPEAEARLMDNLGLFAASRPRFISVTCGAGGTNGSSTYDLACAIQARYGVPTARPMAR